MYDLLLPLLGLLFILPVNQASEQQDSFWEFLREVSQDDTFLYSICDSRFVDTVTSESGRCYDITLDIKNILYMNNNTYYYIHAVTQDNAGTQDRLFVIDANQYKIRTVFAQDRDYAVSLQNTIFWRGGWGNIVETTYGKETRVNLEVNNPDTAFIISDSFVAQNGAIQYIASYDNFQQSFFEINSDIPLPVGASISGESARQTAKVLFSFELQDYRTDAAVIDVVPTFHMTQNDTTTTVATTTVVTTTTYPEIINPYIKVKWQ